MKFLWIFIGLIGLWFIVSAATENGLLPSGHGIGRIWELMMGVILVAYALFRWRGRAIRIRKNSN